MSLRVAVLNIRLMEARVDATALLKDPECKKTSILIVDLKTETCGV